MRWWLGSFAAAKRKEDQRVPVFSDEVPRHGPEANDLALATVRVRIASRKDPWMENPSSTALAGLADSSRENFDAVRAFD
ncbi:MAG: hypothetical protein AMXMBFR36_26640 [Acidobacteriota bacterium]